MQDVKDQVFELLSPTFPNVEVESVGYFQEGFYIGVRIDHDKKPTKSANKFRVVWNAI